MGLPAVPKPQPAAIEEAPNERGSSVTAHVSRIAVALVVAGGGVWVLAAVLYSIQVITCFSCGSVLVAPGIQSGGFPLSAIHTLAWDALYANLYVGTIGLLSIIVGITGFRRGERWAWYAVAVVVLAGIMTAFLDYLSWGGWYTFLFLGLVPLVGLLISTRSFFTPAGASQAHPPAGPTMQVDLDH